MLDQLYQFPEGQIVAFMLILIRMIAFIVSMPIIGTATVPVKIKVLFPMVLSFLIFPTILPTIQGAPGHLAINEMVIAYAFREVLVGLFLGFFTRMFFFAVSISGELIGLSSGLASAQIFNPALGTQTNVFEQFQTLLATLIFLALNGHHVFIDGLVRSYTALPVGQLTFNTAAIGNLADMVSYVLLLGLQIAAPVILSVFLANLSMGIIGKAVPQMNVLVTSMQTTVLVTMVVLLIIAPVTLGTMSGILDKMAGEFFTILKVI